MKKLSILKNLKNLLNRTEKNTTPTLLELTEALSKDLSDSLLATFVGKLSATQEVLSTLIDHVKETIKESSALISAEINGALAPKLNDDDIPSEGWYRLPDNDMSKIYNLDLSKITIQKDKRFRNEAYNFIWAEPNFALVEDFANCNGIPCGCGDNWLDYVYVFVIRKLQKAGLLPEDYEMKCCDCHARDNRRGNEEV